MALPTFTGTDPLRAARRALGDVHLGFGTRAAPIVPHWGSPSDFELVAWIEVTGSHPDFLDTATLRDGFLPVYRLRTAHERIQP